MRDFNAASLSNNLCYLMLSLDKYYFFTVGTFQMRQVAGEDIIHRTLDTAIRCGYRLVGESI